jgi:NADH dehydrogenase
VTDRRTITVFGGTGFLGRRVVRQALDHGFAVRIAVRHPTRAAEVFGERPSLEAIEADAGDDRAVAEATASAWGAVNCVSLYVERRGSTFHNVHVDAAARIAGAARAAGAARVVHVSGIGADGRSRSAYVRSRGEGEAAVRDAFPDAVIVRPSVMFAADDAFLAGLAGMLRVSPVFPLFGAGNTRLQPAHVGDVAEAIARILDRPRPAPLYEFAGPRVIAYKALLQEIAAHIGRRRLLVPVPFAVWQMLAAGAGLLPNPPLTDGQVALMRRDNVAESGLPGFAALNIAPRDIETVLGGQA